MLALLLAWQAVGGDALGPWQLGTPGSSRATVAQVLGEQGILRAESCDGQVQQLIFSVPFSEVVLPSERYPAVRQTPDAVSDAAMLTLALYERMSLAGWRGEPLSPRDFWAATPAHFSDPDLPEQGPVQWTVRRSLDRGPHHRELVQWCSGTRDLRTCEVSVVAGEGC